MTGSTTIATGVVDVCNLEICNDDIDDDADGDVDRDDLEYQLPK